MKNTQSQRSYIMACFNNFHVPATCIDLAQIRKKMSFFNRVSI